MDRVGIRACQQGSNGREVKGPHRTPGSGRSRIGSQAGSSSSLEDVTQSAGLPPSLHLPSPLPASTTSSLKPEDTSESSQLLYSGHGPQIPPSCPVVVTPSPVSTHQAPATWISYWSSNKQGPFCPKALALIVRSARSVLPSTLSRACPPVTQISAQAAIE